MSIEQSDVRTVKRTCRILDRTGKPCGRTYYVVVGSKKKGCPDCYPELAIVPPPDKESVS
jgi:protein-arginine kinase activator protein McsA